MRPLASSTPPTVGGLRGARRAWGVGAAAALALALLVPPAMEEAARAGAGDAENPFVEAERVASADGPYVVVLIGYAPESFDAARAWSGERVAAAAEAWWREHMDDRIVDVRAWQADGEVFAYRVTYLPEGAVPAGVLGGEPPRDPLRAFDVIQRGA